MNKILRLFVFNDVDCFKIIYVVWEFNLKKDFWNYNMLLYLIIESLIFILLCFYCILINFLF